jgi:hypothetical protein
MLAEGIQPAWKSTQSSNKTVFALRNGKQRLNCISMLWIVCRNQSLQIVELELAGRITGHDMRGATTECIY